MSTSKPCSNSWYLSEESSFGSWRVILRLRVVFECSTGSAVELSSNENVEFPVLVLITEGSVEATDW